MKHPGILLSVLFFLVAAAVRSSGSADGEHSGAVVERKTCAADDGVRIVYSAAGNGPVALALIHGGLANRTFWDSELRAFASRYRVIAPDLPGHGESGSNRQKWGIPEFGADLRAVVEAEKLKKVILFGNSLGGPVGIEAALLLPGKALAVVGVDTFHRLDYKMTPEQASERAQAFRRDYSGSVKQIMKELFHPDADPAIVADAERRLASTSPEAAYNLFLSLAGYNPVDSARRLQIPLLAINGDLYPTDVDGNRKIKPDFEVLIMKHMGHYPMLERPAEFDRLVAEVAERFSRVAR
jgi:pimeloyl-ACP methyl ester carboxylesterase